MNQKKIESFARTTHFIFYVVLLITITLAPLLNDKFIFTQIFLIILAYGVFLFGVKK